MYLQNQGGYKSPLLLYQRDESGAKASLNQMQDLASRYKFNPMTGDTPCGEEISGYLVSTFNSFGAPLFLKRDNGGNLNHSAVNDVLADYFVMPVKIYDSQEVAPR